MAKKDKTTDTVSVVLPETAAPSQPTQLENNQFDWRAGHTAAQAATAAPTEPEPPQQATLPAFSPAAQPAPAPSVSVPPQDAHAVQPPVSSDTAADIRPPLAPMTLGIQRGGLYTDSGRTVCIALRVISYLLFAMSPVSFIAQILSIFNKTYAYQTVSVQSMLAAVMWAVVYAVCFVAAGLMVVAVIKILQNLMALPKKK